jgi:uncharacterized membrane protein YhaH (DUF805 family)
MIKGMNIKGCSCVFMLHFKQGISAAISRYMDYSGRSSRKEFWMPYLLYTLIMSVVGVFSIYQLYMTLDMSKQEQIVQFSTELTVLSNKIGLISCLAYIWILPLMVRRFQDTDRDGTACIVMVGCNIFQLLLTFVLLHLSSYVPAFLVYVNGMLGLPLVVLTIYVYCICIFKGSEGVNDFGMPSTVLSRNPMA